MRGILLSSITGLLLALTAQAQGLEMVPIYRFYRPDTVDHLYSNAPAAESPVVSWAYNAEGPAFSVAAKPAPGLIPLYRFFKPTGGHYYDTNPGGGARFKCRHGRCHGIHLAGIPTWFESFICLVQP